MFDLQPQRVVAARELAVARDLAAGDEADRERQQHARDGDAAPAGRALRLQALVLLLDQLLHVLHVAVVARVVARLQQALLARVQIERARAVAGVGQRGAEVAQHADARVRAGLAVVARQHLVQLRLGLGEAPERQQRERLVTQALAFHRGLVVRRQEGLGAVQRGERVGRMVQAKFLGAERDDVLGGAAMQSGRLRDLDGLAIGGAAGLVLLAAVENVAGERHDVGLQRGVGLLLGERLRPRDQALGQLGVLVVLRQRGEDRGGLGLEPAIARLHRGIQRHVQVDRGGRRVALALRAVGREQQRVEPVEAVALRCQRGIPGVAVRRITGDCGARLDVAVLLLPAAELEVGVDQMGVGLGDGADGRGQRAQGEGGRGGLLGHVVVGGHQAEADQQGAGVVGAGRRRRGLQGVQPGLGALRILVALHDQAIDGRRQVRRPSRGQRQQQPDGHGCARQRAALPGEARVAARKAFPAHGGRCRDGDSAEPWRPDPILRLAATPIEHRTGAFARFSRVCTQVLPDQQCDRIGQRRPRTGVDLQRRGQNVATATASRASRRRRSTSRSRAP